MTPFATIRLIVTRELRERAVRRSFVLGTAATALLVAAFIVVPTLFAGGETELHIGVVGGTPTLLTDPGAAEALDVDRLEVVTYDDVDAAEAAVLDGEVELALVDGSQLLTDGSPPAAVVPTLEASLASEATRERLAEAGLDADEIAAVLAAPPTLEVVDLSGLDEDGADFLVAIATLLLLVVGIQLAGTALLSGALEEKSNRVVEVLVAAARPWQLLTGKVTATSALVLTQLAVVVGTALAANAAVDAFELPPATGRTLAITVVFLVAGFLFYAALFTVAGTLGGSLEDGQSTATPLYILMYGAYGAVFATVLPDPDGLVAQILTFVPPTAPFVAPPRAAVGALPDWQLAVSLLITFLGAYVAVRIAGRTYAASLLAGGTLTWRDALKAEPVR